MKTRITTNQQHTSTRGFTVLEIVVTMIVLSIFLFGFFQGYIVLESQRIIVARQARASDIAYSNLRKVTTRPTSLTQQVCTDNAATMDLTTGSPSTKTGLDITQYGYTLEPDADVTGSLGSDATQTLAAFAPAGCSGLSTNPIKIVSTVTFGTNGDKAVHATYLQ